MNVGLLITIVHKLAVIQLDHTLVLVELDIKIMDMEIVLVRACISYFVLKMLEEASIRQFNKHVMLLMPTIQSLLFL